MPICVAQYLTQGGVDIDSQPGRQRLLNAALRLTGGTTRAPEPYEQFLLKRFVEGQLTIAEVMQRLEAHELLNARA